MSDAVRPDWSGRFRALRQANKHDRLDALVVSTPANLRYLTGFAGSAGLLVLTDDAGWLVVDGRYTGAVSEGIAAGELASVRMEKVEQRVDQTLAGLLHRVGAKRIGFEAAHVTVATLRSWQGLTSGVEWLPTERLVERRRVVKDRFELDVLRRAAVLLSDVARQLGQLVAAGRTERDVARDIDAALDRAGFSEPGVSDHRRVRAQQRASARAADESAAGRRRPGRAGLRRGVRRILRRPDANGRGRSGQRPSAGAVRRRCAQRTDRRDRGRARRRRRRRTSTRPRATVLEARGLGEAFLHATGHGLGLEVHEAPRLSPEPIRAAAERARSRDGLHDRTRRVRRRARRGAAGGRRARDG